MAATALKLIGFMAILIAAYIILVPGGNGNFNTIVSAISTNLAKLTNQLQGQGQYSPQA